MKQYIPYIVQINEEGAGAPGGRPGGSEPPMSGPGGRKPEPTVPKDEEVPPDGEKYGYTGRKVTVDDGSQTLWQIVLKVNLAVNCRHLRNETIKAGTVGGYIKPGQLSQEGSCFVHRGCSVYDDGSVEEDAQLISTNPGVLGNMASVAGGATLKGRAIAYDGATITGTSEVSGDAAVSGSWTSTDGMAVVTGSAQVYDGATISGSALVDGEALVLGSDTYIGGRAHVGGKARVESGSHTEGEIL